MKTTLDLPETLVREMKLRAAREGRKLKDVAAEVFQRGLRYSPEKASDVPRSEKLTEPLFVCEESEAPASRMTVEALLDLERQAIEVEDRQRVSRSV